MAFRYRYKPKSGQNKIFISAVVVVVLGSLFIIALSNYQPKQPEVIATTTTTGACPLKYCLEGYDLDPIICNCVPIATTTAAPVSEKGELTIALKDDAQTLENNLGKATSLILKINSIEVHKAGEGNESGEWIVLSNDTKEIDLITFSETLAGIVSKELDSGKYTQIRLGVEQASVKIYYLQYSIFNKTYPLKVPSNEVKLNHPFEIEKNKLLVLTLDFEVPKSVIRQSASADNPSGYTLKPVVAITEQKLEKGQKPSNVEAI
jgi:hypothetical protein